MAGVADSHGVVPAAGGHGAPLRGALVTHALAARAAVVDGQARRELPLALAAGLDVLVGDPVGGARRVLHQAWEGGAEGWSGDTPRR